MTSPGRHVFVQLAIWKVVYREVTLFLQVKVSKTQVVRKKLKTSYNKFFSIGKRSFVTMVDRVGNVKCQLVAVVSVFLDAPS